MRDLFFIQSDFNIYYSIGERKNKSNYLKTGYFRMLYIKSGSLFFKYMNKKYTLNSGSILVVNDKNECILESCYKKQIEAFVITFSRSVFAGTKGDNEFLRVLSFPSLSKSLKQLS